MAGETGDVPQVALELGGSIASQLRGYLTDQFWMVVGLVLLGMVFGIATAGGARLSKYGLDRRLPWRDYERRVLMLKRIAYAFGAGWTFLALLVFLQGELPALVLLGVCLAGVAGLGTPKMYDLLRWTFYKALPALGHWLMEVFFPAVGRYLLERFNATKSLLSKKE